MAPVVERRPATASVFGRAEKEPSVWSHARAAILGWEPMSSSSKRALNVCKFSALTSAIVSEERLRRLCLSVLSPPPQSEGRQGSRKDGDMLATTNWWSVPWKRSLAELLCFVSLPKLNSRATLPSQLRPCILSYLHGSSVVSSGYVFVVLSGSLELRPNSRTMYSRLLTDHMAFASGIAGDFLDRERLTEEEELEQQCWKIGTREEENRRQRMQTRILRPGSVWGNELSSFEETARVIASPTDLLRLDRASYFQLTQKRRGALKPLSLAHVDALAIAGPNSGFSVQEECFGFLREKCKCLDGIISEALFKIARCCKKVVLAKGCTIASRGDVMGYALFIRRGSVFVQPRKHSISSSTTASLRTISQLQRPKSAAVQRTVRGISALGVGAFIGQSAVLEAVAKLGGAEAVHLRLEQMWRRGLKSPDRSRCRNLRSVRAQRYESQTLCAATEVVAYEIDLQSVPSCMALDIACVLLNTWLVRADFHKACDVHHTRRSRATLGRPRPTTAGGQRMTRTGLRNKLYSRLAGVGTNSSTTWVPLGNRINALATLWNTNTRDAGTRPQGLERHEKYGGSSTASIRRAAMRKPTLKSRRQEREVVIPAYPSLPF